ACSCADVGNAGVNVVAEVDRDDADEKDCGVGAGDKAAHRERVGFEERVPCECQGHEQDAEGKEVAALEAVNYAPADRRGEKVEAEENEAEVDEDERQNEKALEGEAAFGFGGVGRHGPE